MQRLTVFLDSEWDNTVYLSTITIVSFMDYSYFEGNNYLDVLFSLLLCICSGTSQNAEQNSK